MSGDRVIDGFARMLSLLGVNGCVQFLRCDLRVRREPEVLLARRVRHDVARWHRPREAADVRRLGGKTQTFLRNFEVMPAPSQIADIENHADKPDGTIFRVTFYPCSSRHPAPLRPFSANTE